MLVLQRRELCILEISICRRTWNHSSQGIGDTIRVSLTGAPLEEIKSAKRILKTLGLRKGGVEVVSCPTCGRTRIDLIGLANKVEAMVQDIPLDIKLLLWGAW